MQADPNSPLYSVKEFEALPMSVGFITKGFMELKIVQSPRPVEGHLRSGFQEALQDSGKGLAHVVEQPVSSLFAIDAQLILSGLEI